MTQRAAIVGQAIDTNTVTALLPDWQELNGLLQALREQQAPFFVVHGRKPADLLRLALNVPIRIFGYKQARFNTQLLNLLEEVLVSVQTVRWKIAQQEVETAALRGELHMLVVSLTESTHSTDASK